jgi:hypothetical protein
MLRVGVVGHRHLGEPRAAAFVARQCEEALASVCREHAAVVALSAIAEGADTHFAEAALSLNIPLEVIRPFDEYALDFDAPTARALYKRLLSRARSETRLPYHTRSEEAYVKAMNWVVDQSDLLVVAWDGRQGVTANSARRVTRRGGAWLHIDPTRQAVTFHAGSSTLT